MMFVKIILALCMLVGMVAERIVPSRLSCSW